MDGFGTLLEVVAKGGASAVDRADKREEMKLRQKQQDLENALKERQLMIQQARDLGLVDKRLYNQSVQGGKDQEEPQAPPEQDGPEEVTEIVDENDEFTEKPSMKPRSAVDGGDNIARLAALRKATGKNWKHSSQRGFFVDDGSAPDQPDGLLKPRGLLQKPAQDNVPEGFVKIPGFKTPRERDIENRLAMLNAQSVDKGVVWDYDPVRGYYAKKGDVLTEGGRLKLEKEKLDLQEQMKKNSPQGKLEKLSGEARGRFDNVVMGLTALKQLEDQIAQNPSGLSRVGLLRDNPYTVAAREWEEAIGRMQSGGAITTDEGKRFKALIPGPLDSPEVTQTKIANMKNLMTQRYRTFGFKPEDAEKLGLDGQSLAFSSGGSKARGPLATSMASSLSDQDKEALSWARANKSDPRAKAILKKLGM